jgi:hypothetical protein
MSFRPLPTVLVDGTFGYGGNLADAARWIGPASPWRKAAEEHGVILLGRADPFVWSTAAGGIGWARWTRSHVDWKAGGEAVRWFSTLKARELHEVRAARVSGSTHGITHPVPVPLELHYVVYSHALQVVAYGLSRPVRQVKPHTVIALGGPPRDDMRKLYERLVRRVERVVHISGGTHGMFERMGQWLDGIRGEKTLADLVPEELRPKITQLRADDDRDLTDPRLMSELGLWALLQQ